MGNPHLSLVFDDAAPDGEWRIVIGVLHTENYQILWGRAYDREEDLDEYNQPPDMRAEYERIIGKDEFSPQGGVFNVVELVADEQGAIQPCQFGNLVEGHAVYCHNEGWLYSPRKCRRTWYTGGGRRDEDCPGFRPSEGCRATT